MFEKWVRSGWGRIREQEGREGGGGRRRAGALDFIAELPGKGGARELRGLQNSLGQLLDKQLGLRDSSPCDPSPSPLSPVAKGWWEAVGPTVSEHATLGTHVSLSMNPNVTALEKGAVLYTPFIL